MLAVLATIAHCDRSVSRAAIVISCFPPTHSLSTKRLLEIPRPSTFSLAREKGKSLPPSYTLLQSRYFSSWKHAILTFCSQKIRIRSHRQRFYDISHLLCTLSSHKVSHTSISRSTFSAQFVLPFFRCSLEMFLSP